MKTTTRKIKRPIHAPNIIKYVGCKVRDFRKRKEGEKMKGFKKSSIEYQTICNNLIKIKELKRPIRFCDLTDKEAEIICNLCDVFDTNYIISEIIRIAQIEKVGIYDMVGNENE